MGTAYSQDLRDRVMAARDRGMKTKQVADLFDVSASWVRRILQRRRECGQTTARPRGGATVVKIDLQRLGQLVEQQPDATIKQLHERLGVACSQSAVGMALRRLGFSFKKRRSTPRSKIGLTWPNAAAGGVSNNLNVMRVG
jgi:transposase